MKNKAVFLFQILQSPKQNVTKCKIVVSNLTNFMSNNLVTFLC